MDSDITTIQVTTSTRDRLSKYLKHRESFDKGINRILDTVEGKKK